MDTQLRNCLNMLALYCLNVIIISSYPIYSKIAVCISVSVLIFSIHSVFSGNIDFKLAEEASHFFISLIFLPHSS